MFSGSFGIKIDSFLTSWTKKMERQWLPIAVFLQILQPHRSFFLFSLISLSFFLSLFLPHLSLVSLRSLFLSILSFLLSFSSLILFSLFFILFSSLFLSLCLSFSWVCECIYSSRILFIHVFCKHPSVHLEQGTSREIGREKKTRKKNRRTEKKEIY